MELDTSQHFIILWLEKAKELYVNLTCQQNDISGDIMNHGKERKELIRIIS